MLIIKHPSTIDRQKNIKQLNILIEQYVKVDKSKVKIKVQKEQ